MNASQLTCRKFYDISRREESGGKEMIWGQISVECKAHSHKGVNTDHDLAPIQWEAFFLFGAGG